MISICFPTDFMTFILKDIGNENFYFLYPLNLPTEYLIFSFCAFVAFRSCK